MGAGFYAFRYIIGQIRGYLDPLSMCNTDLYVQWVHSKSAAEICRL